MWPFKNNSTNANLAAVTLDAVARTAMTAKLFLDMEPKIARRIDSLLHLTRVAIILKWLRILKSNSASVTGWEVVTDKFEKLSFPSQAEREAAAEYLGGLTQHINDLESNFRQRLSEPEMWTRWRKWWESWLASATEDDAVVVEVGDRYGLTLMMSIYRDISELGEFIQQVGKETRIG